MPTPFQQEGGGRVGGITSAGLGSNRNENATGTPVTSVDGEQGGGGGGFIGMEIGDSSLNITSVSALSPEDEEPSNAGGDYKDLGGNGGYFDQSSQNNNHYYHNNIPSSQSSPSPPLTTIPVAHALPMGYLSDPENGHPYLPPPKHHRQGYPPTTGMYGGPAGENPPQRIPGGYQRGYPPAANATTYPPFTATNSSSPSPPSGHKNRISTGNTPSNNDTNNEATTKSWCRKNYKYLILALALAAAVGAAVGAMGINNNSSSDKNISNNRDDISPVSSNTKPIPDKASLIRSVDVILSNNNDDNEDVQAVRVEYGLVSEWDVSQVTDFSQLFDAKERNPDAAAFNMDISKWNTTMATTTFAMFRGATSFHQDISSWNVERVTDFSFMFQGATAFNADISQWKPVRAVTMESMLEGASSFSQNLCPWWDNLLSPSVNLSWAFTGTACDERPPEQEEVMNGGDQAYYLCSVCPAPTSPHDNPTTTTSTMATPTTTASTVKSCFTNLYDLHLAVDTYLQNPLDSLLVNKYGHPIGTWCVGQLRSFRQVFSAKRNLANADFNQDLSQWDTSKATSLHAMFDGATSFNQALSSWDVSSVTDFSFMFINANTFNGDLSSWDTSRGLYFNSLFQYARSFNRDISMWNIENALDMENMFLGASSFDQNLCVFGEKIVADDVLIDSMFAETQCPRTENPDLSFSIPGPFCHACGEDETTAPVQSPTTAQPVPPPAGTTAPTQPSTTSEPMPTAVPQPRACFTSLAELQLAADNYMQDPTGGLTADQYGHPIGSWCVGAVESFESLFSAIRNPMMEFFNEPLSDWDVSGAFDMFSMFDGARNFNQDISTWDVSNVVSFGAMFSNATKFNSDLSGWDTSSAIQMSLMFFNATNFDAPIGVWDVGRVQYFSGMFTFASKFKGNLTNWNVRLGREFFGMFAFAESFESDLSGWDMIRATDTSLMFAGCPYFSSDLSSWNVFQVIDMSFMFAFAEAFDSDLSAWDVGSVVDMEQMFYDASSFSHDLCPWGLRLNPTTSVLDAFRGTACDSWDDPDFNANPPGPFCAICA